MFYLLFSTKIPKAVAEEVRGVQAPSEFGMWEECDGGRI